MMELMFLLQSITLIASVHAIDCDEIDPFQLPIRDVQVVSDIPDSFMKGIAATIGTPPQDIVLLPWPDLNNSWIYDQQAYCDSTIIWNDVICQVRRGNYYEEGNSSTWAKVEDITVAGGAGTETQSQGEELGVSKLISTSLGGTDQFAFNSIKTLASFPVGVPRLDWDHGYTMLHAMGMGTNSTVLNALLQTGQIGSRVWSIFWGRMWVDDGSAMDGSIVFGGYDQQKTIGKNYTQALDFNEHTGCWTGMKVHISKIQLNFRNGDDQNLLPLNTEIDVCIVPQRQLLLEGPQSIVDTFEEATDMQNNGRSFGLHWSAFLYDALDAFDGDMTISLSTGLDIRVPNSQYLVPYVDIDRNGSRIFNTSERELLISAVSDTSATLGRYFLTAAYLMVDLDANTFTLWQANPTSDSKLVSRTTESECGNKTSSSSDVLPSSHSQAPQVASGLSKGSIAGIVVGVVAGLAILGLGILFYIRRARNNQTVTGPPDVADGAIQFSELPVMENTKPMYSLVHELRGSPAAVSEVSGQAHYTYEMDGNTRN
ncbi:acid protease [Jackrogersella minutella]|nr:acid protease [Jackrogersella minutella]